MADKTDSRDDLIEKLDHLIGRGRAPAAAQPADLPVLTEALPKDAGDPIPTLTEAVAGPGQGQERQLGRNELELVVAMRLAENIEREIARLGGEFPAQREALNALRRAVVKSLPDLVRRAWAAQPETTENTRIPASGDAGKRD
jgi:hypothetical protein